MNCSEFEEIAESYLSGELLVETNHDLMRHLDHCAACRGSLGRKRELKARFRSLVRATAKPSPSFVTQLRSQIRDQYRPKRTGVLVPAVGFVAVLIALLMGLSALIAPRFFPSGESARADLEEVLRQTGLMAALHDALDTHKDCGIKFAERPAMTSASDSDFAALRSDFSENIQIVEKHDCYFKGRKYSHTIFRDGDKLISVLRTASDTNSRATTMVSVPVDNLQVAEFQAEGKSVFVVSDHAESENIKIARALASKI